MADYPQPTEILPDFNPSVFRTNDVSLTIAEGEKYFLTYPTAQGAESIPTLTTGTLNVSGSVNITNSSTKGTAYGYQTSVPTTGTGGDNTSFGYQAGRYFSTLTDSGGNTAFGALAMGNGVSMVAASNNTAIGHNALYGLTTGTRNTFVGVALQTAPLTTTESNNTTLGFNAKCAVGVSGSTAIGSGALASASNQVVLGTSSQTVGLYTITPIYSSIPTSLDATERLIFPTGAPVGSRCFATQANAGFALVAGQITNFIEFTDIPQGVYMFAGYFDFEPYTNPAFGGYVEATDGTRSAITATITGATTLNVSSNNGIWVNTTSSATFGFLINSASHPYTKVGGTLMRVSLIRIA